MGFRRASCRSDSPVCAPPFFGQAAPRRQKLAGTVLKRASAAELGLKAAFRTPRGLENRNVGALNLQFRNLSHFDNGVFVKN